MATFKYFEHLWNNEIVVTMLPRFLHLLGMIGAIINDSYPFPRYLEYRNPKKENFYLKVLNDIKTITLPGGTLLYHSTSKSPLIKPNSSSEIKLPLYPYSFFALSSDTSIAVMFHFFLAQVQQLQRQGKFPDIKYIDDGIGLVFTFELQAPMKFNWSQLGLSKFIDDYCKLKQENYMGIYFQLDELYFLYDGMLELCVKETDKLKLIRVHEFDFFRDAKEDTHITPTYYNNIYYNEKLPTDLFLLKYNRLIDFNKYIVEEIPIYDIY